MASGANGPFSLARDPETREYFGQTNNLGYNPRRAEFGCRYVLKTADGTTYTVKADTGNLERVEDANGNVTEYEYQAGGKLSLVKRGDYKVFIGCDGNNNNNNNNNNNRVVWVAGSTDPAETLQTVPPNRKVVYGSDANGDLTTVTDRANSTITYTYDHHAERPRIKHFLTKVTDPPRSGDHRG